MKLSEKYLVLPQRQCDLTNITFRYCNDFVRTRIRKIFPVAVRSNLAAKLGVNVILQSQ